MPELNENTPATVPEQPESKPPLRKSMPVVIALVVIMALIGIANISSLLHGNKRNAPSSALPMRPTAPNAQQVSSFESQQQLQAQHDTQERQHQQEIAAALAQLQQVQDTPGPESPAAPQMTAAQRAAIYGDSPNAPHNTSGLSEAQAEAKQKQLAIEKQKQDALNSDTLAIDFERPAGTTSEPAPETASTKASAAPAKADSKNPMAPYDFDSYDGRLYRVFEGTVLEGVVTNHIDGGFSGPIMVSLTTELYSHDHQQLLLPQATAQRMVARRKIA
jgi:type IV secretory pathway VirB10-like protein